MHIRAVACSLPNPEFYLVFHSHIDERKAVWEEKDQLRYISLQHHLTELHRNPSLVKELNNEQYTALMPEGVDLEEALQRLVPYVVSANRASRRPRYLHVDRDMVTQDGEIGREGYHGIQFYVIAKKTQHLIPEPGILEQVFQRNIRRGNTVAVVGEGGELLPLEQYRPGRKLQVDGEIFDVDSLAFRSDPHFVNLVRRERNRKKLLREGHCKIVAVPNGIDITLSRNKGGEVIQEVARLWS